MYSETARKRRQCTATRPDGEPCQAFAEWDSQRQRCFIHGGEDDRPRKLRRHPLHGMAGVRRRRAEPEPKPKVQPCTCVAYRWPHRPGGGLCRWPEEPEYRRTTPPSTHSAEYVLKRSMTRWLRR